MCRFGWDVARNGSHGALDTIFERWVIRPWSGSHCSANLKQNGFLNFLVANTACMRMYLSHRTASYTNVGPNALFGSCRIFATKEWMAPYCVPRPYQKISSDGIKARRDSQESTNWQTATNPQPLRTDLSQISTSSCHRGAASSKKYVYSTCCQLRLLATTTAAGLKYGTLSLQRTISILNDTFSFNSLCHRSCKECMQVSFYSFSGAAIVSARLQESTTTQPCAPT